MENVVFPWTWDKEQKIRAVSVIVVNGQLKELIGETE